MPKIRKKTSRRQPTRMRAKIHKMAKEHNRKAKRDAKRDPTWKSRHKKDPGIPALFPYKDRLIQEARDTKASIEEARRAGKEEASASPGIMVDNEMDSHSVDEDDDEGSDDQVLDSSNSNLKAHAKSLRSVISQSDVVIQVLDARDPEGTRSRAVERDVMMGHTQAKKLVFVLNKIDLVPRENVEGWLASLRRSFPTFPLKSSTQHQRQNLGSSKQKYSSNSSQASSSTAPLLSLLKTCSKTQAPGTSLTIGVIGFPNVGKSSLINTLKRSKACAVAPTPGFTKQVQLVNLDGGLNILDCPGVVLDHNGSASEKALRNVVKVESIDDPITPVEAIVDKCNKEHLMMLYNIPAFATAKDFIIAAARSKGRLKKGGIPDLSGTARQILRDWTSGKIPYYTVPSKVSTAKDASASTNHDTAMTVEEPNATEGDKIVQEFGKEFDLDSLFAEADSAVLQDVKSRSEMKTSVRMKESLLKDNSEDGDQAMLMGESLESADVAGDMDFEQDVPELVSITSKGQMEMDEDNSGAKLLPPKKKRVTFAEGEGGKSEKRKQAERMFGDEAPDITGVNNLKKTAKAAKKRKDKEARRQQANAENAMEGVTAMQPDAVDVPSRDQPYDFSQFFGASRADEDVPM